jgi:hypothetical protein
MRVRAAWLLLCPFSLACIGTTYEAGDHTMSVPGPLAFQCSSDAGCGTHRCNTQSGADGKPYNKCAFPCVSGNADCLSGTMCLAGLCVPKPPGS